MRSALHGSFHHFALQGCTVTYHRDQGLIDSCMNMRTTLIAFFVLTVDIRPSKHNLLAVLSCAYIPRFGRQFTERLRSYCRHSELKHFPILLQCQRKSNDRNTSIRFNDTLKRLKGNYPSGRLLCLNKTLTDIRIERFFKVP